MNEEAWILDSQSDKGVNLMKWQDFIDWNDLFVRLKITIILFKIILL